MPRPTPFLVLTTVSKKSDTKRISKTLVEKKLAACVTTLPPGESRYQWKGRICVEREFVLLIKTLSNVFPKLEKELRAIHPYECPEIIGIPIQKIYRKYLGWLTDNTL